MEHKFKVGDKIRGIGGDIQGCEGIIEEISQEGYPSIRITKNGGQPWQIGNSSFAVGNLFHRSVPWTGYLELMLPETPEIVNYILQYELDKDPFETFSTMAEVKARIKELSDRTDLKRDSLRLYTISKIEKVELSTAVTFKAIDQTPSPRKRAKKAN